MSLAAAVAVAAVLARLEPQAALAPTPQSPTALHPQLGQLVGLAQVLAAIKMLAAQAARALWVGLVAEEVESAYKQQRLQLLRRVVQEQMAAAGVAARVPSTSTRRLRLLELLVMVAAAVQMLAQVAAVAVALQ
jgi:hypothetical protein